MFISRMKLSVFCNFFEFGQILFKSIQNQSKFQKISYEKKTEISKISVLLLPSEISVVSEI